MRRCRHYKIFYDKNATKLRYIIQRSKVALSSQWLRQEKTATIGVTDELSFGGHFGPKLCGIEWLGGLEFQSWWHGRLTSSG